MVFLVVLLVRGVQLRFRCNWWGNTILSFDATWVVPELSDDQGAHFKRGFLGHAFDIAFCGE